MIDISNLRPGISLKIIQDCYNPDYKSISQGKLKEIKPTRVDLPFVDLLAPSKKGTIMGGVIVQLSYCTAVVHKFTKKSEQVVPIRLRLVLSKTLS